MIAGVRLLLVALAVQDPSPPPQYTGALERLAQHDTAGALTLLRVATRDAPKFGPAFLRLGSILSAQAGEVPEQFRERLEAERALRRASQLLGDDPEVLLEFGLLLRKQQSRIDAQRVLDRAAAAAARRGESLPVEQRARVHYALGLIYETWWEDWQNLLEINDEFARAVWCPRVEGALYGPPMVALGDALVACPEKWNAVREVGRSLAERKGSEREQMVWHFRETLRADSGHVDAALHLLGHLADAGDWDEYERVARRLVAIRNDNPRVHLFWGLGLHQRGRDSLAGEELRAGIARLTPEDRQVFEDVGPLLPAGARAAYAKQDSAGRAATARVFFAATNPLYLVGIDERRLEHYARLAWADLKFGADDVGHRGWDTDRGRIWVRYGPPRDWFQCCYGAGSRRVFWSYGPRGPVFVFKKELTVHTARFTDPSNFLATEMEKWAPELYRPPTITDVRFLPLQIARFRGSRPGDTHVEIYALPPVDSLGDSSLASIEAGLFVFDRYYQPMWSTKQSLRRGQAAIGVNYGFEVGPGVYRFAVEAREEGPSGLARPAARVRDSLVVPGFATGALALSDLLLADSIVPLVENPAARAELRVRPSRTLRVPRGAPVNLYFELYGLTGDANGLAHYELEVSVEDSTKRHPIVQIARGLVRLFTGETSQGSVAFSRSAPLGADRNSDFLSVELGDLPAGDYVVRVRARDEATGASAAAGRRFRVVKR